MTFEEDVKIFDSKEMRKAAAQRATAYIQDDATRDMLVSNLEAAGSVGLSLPADIQITVDFINAGVIYTVLDWLRKRPPPDDELLIELEKILKTLFRTT